MKKTRFMALLMPMLLAMPVVLVDGVACADSGGRNSGGRGGTSVSRESSGRGGTEFVARQGGRDVVARSGSRGGGVVTRSGGRGGYVGSRGGRGGYSTRYVSPGHSHGHFSGSIWIGPSWGLWDPFWYPYYPGYRYYTPPTVVVPQEPQEYILPESQQETGYWYYCRNPEGYYPYVERCPSGWMRVLPDTTPPDEQDEEEKEDGQ